MFTAATAAAIFGVSHTSYTPAPLPAAEALKVAQPEIMRAVTKGVAHKNTASRKVSRLSARIKAMG